MSYRMCKVLRNCGNPQAFVPKTKTARSLQRASRAADGPKTLRPEGLSYIKNAPASVHVAHPFRGEAFRPPRRHPTLVPASSGLRE
jgi:hypothetical protein